MSTTATTLQPLDAALFEEMLAPYKPHCRYLLEATVESPGDEPLLAHDGTATLLRARGTYAIPEPCYIDSTGHLNAVEVNICYNQLLYVILGQAVARGLVPELGVFSLDHYRERRLPDVLIYHVDVRFRQVIDSSSFQGELSITRATDAKRSVKLETHLCFWDADGGEASGDISIAILKPTS